MLAIAWEGEWPNFMKTTEWLGRALDREVPSSC
jgi:hypothetical protein